ncbi:lamin tail domain-containing protein [Georgenia subflava]|uniref:PQQ-binding-like beta-propeller repeat protein n=1 Tax=Georgenia subflava TaxID=1622177 RepID=A0A6N7ECB7_9MICO|nr:lamin tail domain-containing protein [Georgenia subflava]MPV35620.1 PQQ-binding-like beta-propeller repeat protein [Georgenia subflava]
MISTRKKRQPAYLLASFAAIGALVGAVSMAPAHAEPSAGSDAAPAASASPDSEPTAWDVAHSEISASKITVGSADSGWMPDGTYRMFAVTNSVPDARLVEIDVHEQKVINSYVLSGSRGSWGTTIAPDGTVWVASNTQGVLWELPFGAEEPTAHPRPTPDSSFLWEVEVDEGGNVYVGTYEGYADPAVPGRLAKFGTDDEWTVYDGFREDSHYVRAVGVLGDKVYAGTGSVDGQLWEVDPETGDRVEIPLPDAVGECTFVYGVDPVGDKLAVRLQKCTDGTSDVGYFYDPATGEWSDWSIPVYPSAISQPDADGTVYVASSNVINALDPTTGEITPLSGSGTSGSKDVELFVNPANDAKTVISISMRGKVILHDVDAGTYETFTPDGLTGDTGQTARTAIAGPDGNYHVSLRRAGGLGTFDLSTGDWGYEPGLGQAQGMGEHDGKIYIGIYPTAHVMVYDPAQPWSADNPTSLFRLSDEGQDRPFAFTSAGDQVAIGTIAGYGELTGALTFYDPATGERVLHKPFEDRGIGALTYHDGVVYGGTMIYGGGGSTPVHQEGTVFAWDVATETVLWESSPLPGETGIGAITVDDDGRLFAASVGKVVEIDPATGNALQSNTLTDTPSDALSGSWHISDLTWNAVEQALYLSTRTEIVRVSPSTLADITPAPTAGELLRVAEDGTNYWMNGRVVHTGTLPALEPTVVDGVDVVVDEQEGTVTIPEVQGVTFLRDGEVLPAGEYSTPGEWTVVANPDEGYRLDGQRVWSFELVEAEAEVVLNEIMPGGQSMIELYNAGDGSADLSGWALANSNGPAVTYTFGDAVLAPGELLLLEQDESGIHLVGNDEVRLVDPEGALVDSYSWQGVPGAGSFSRCGQGLVPVGVATPGQENACTG